MPTLTGERVVLRAVTEADLVALRVILAEPVIAGLGMAFEDDELLGNEPDGAEAITTFVVERDGRAVGWIGGWEKLDPEYRHAGIDLFLRTNQQAKGLGPEAIRLVCAYLFDERGHHRITIDPAASNTTAIKAYEKVGFRRVGVMRQYERGADGTYRDGVLMDLLRDDLSA